jgi:hypothetical protein
MSIEIFRINESGAGWTALENANASELLDLELALLTKAEMKMLCYVCHVEISKGNACVKHTQVNVRTCQICELAHEGLYCTNCFTGERVRVGKTKFAKVIRLHEIVK